MKDLCSKLEKSIWFGTILNSLKTNIFVRLKFFWYKPISNNAVFIFIEKILKEIYFAFFKIFPLFIKRLL